MTSHSELPLNWADLRTLTGPAAYVPDALDRMMDAESDAEAASAYWTLDNRVVVQGQLFSAAPPLTESLLERMCSGRYSQPGVVRAADLLVELAYGESDASEVERGNAGLGDQCRALVRLNLACVRSLVSLEDDRVRLAVLDLVDRVELNIHAKREFFRSLDSSSWPESTQTRLKDLLRR